MPVPTYDLLMLPVLRLCAEKTWTMKDLVDRVADDLNLNDEEREELLPSGSATVIASRVGALISKGAQKGVLITTSNFSRAVLAVAANQSSHIRLVLIDGSELTKLMVRFGVGVRIARTVEIKSVDQEYFQVAEPE